MRKILVMFQHSARHFTGKKLKEKPGEKPFECNHVQTHTGEKPFKCNLCYSLFTTLFLIKDNVPTDTGEKTFKCNRFHP